MRKTDPVFFVSAEGNPGEIKEESVCNASALVDRMVSDIHEKFGEDLNLKVMCAAFSSHVNRSHLSRVFKQKTGETFNEYLTRIRIQNACRMLRGGKIFRDRNRIPCRISG